MLNISEKGQINLLVSILAEGKKYKTVADLEDKMSLSRRSVFYWLKQTNGALKTLGLDDIQRLSQGGYFLTQSTLDDLQEHNQANARPVLNADERRQMIIWALIQHNPHLSLVNLSERLEVSKNTIIKDFRELTSNLPADTEVINTSHGKALVGSEVSQRQWVYQQLAQQNPLIIQQIQKLPRLQTVTERLTQLQVDTGNSYSGDATQLLIWYIAWLLDRIQDRERELTGVSNYPLDQYSQWCEALLAKYGRITPAEIGNLRKLLLAGQLQQVNEDGRFSKQLLTTTKEVAQRFSSVSGIDLVTDAFLGALATHLYSTYFRIKYNVQYHNANLTDVKLEYSYLMSLTKYALKPFEDFLRSPVSSDELALIAVYFGGEVKRLSPDWLDAEQQPDVILVCTSGIGTSLILYQQLSARYPGISFSQPFSLEEFQKMDLTHGAPKLVLTTAKMEATGDVPILWVQAIPTSSDFQRLSQEFRQLGLLDNTRETKLVHAVLDIITDYARVDDFEGLTASLRDYFQQVPPETKVTPSDRPSLADLLTTSHIQLIDTAENWQTAVHAAMAPLESDSSVEARYADQIIDITLKNGPYMMIKEGVMLAHAKPEDGVNQLGMSLLILKKPTTMTVNGQSKRLQVIFGLASVDRDAHVHALSQLLALLQDEGLSQKLITARHLSDVQAVIGKSTRQQV
ncbi:BglG family transcription antiterminator [Levilactobacillus huananensis]|uniref:BglG family transcription antiterminator n=1 Tax=Levilactobacillus huananensis TaxID=2486019 RepID=UPI0013DDDB80|nr:PTS sugar transporter subunit IIA [Levilactobacillus huananensis]